MRQLLQGGLYRPSRGQPLSLTASWPESEPSTHQRPPRPSRNRTFFQAQKKVPERRSIIWSMRARKKSSMAGQANMWQKLPENSLHWIINWEFRLLGVTWKTSIHASGEGYSGPTNYSSMYEKKSLAFAPTYQVKPLFAENPITTPTPNGIDFSRDFLANVIPTFLKISLRATNVAPFKYC